MNLDNLNENFVTSKGLDELTILFFSLANHYEQNGISSFGIDSSGLELEIRTTEVDELEVKKALRFIVQNQAFDCDLAQVSQESFGLLRLQDDDELTTTWTNETVNQLISQIDNYMQTCMLDYDQYQSDLYNEMKNA